MRSARGPRQVDGNGRSLAELAFDSDLAARLVGETEDLAETKPVPLPTGLVVKKGSNARSITSVVIPQPVS
jgi:hypothetical protein